MKRKALGRTIAELHDKGRLSPTMLFPVHDYPDIKHGVSIVRALGRHFTVVAVDFPHKLLKDKTAWCWLPVACFRRPVGGTHHRTACQCCGGAMLSYTTKVMPFNLPRGNQPRGMVLCFTCFSEELYR